MKKAIMYLMSAFFILTVGCASQAQTPEQTLQSYIKAVKAQDLTTMERLSINETTSSSKSSASSSSSSTDEAESKKIYTMLFGKLEVKTEGNAQISGNTATIKAKVTAPDSKKILQNYIATAFSAALSNAFNSSQASSANTNSMMTKTFQDELSKKDVALTSSELNIQLKQTNGTWKVIVSDNLMDAMTGGMISYAKNISNAFSSSSKS